MGPGLYARLRGSMTLPGKGSLFWKLLGLLALFGLLLATLHVDLSRLLLRSVSYLPEPTQELLRGYAREAEAAWLEEGTAGIARYLDELQKREQVWARIVDADHRPLTARPLQRVEHQRMRFVRQLDARIGRRDGTPLFEIPFRSGQASLVMALPERLNPRRHLLIWEALLQRVVPACLALLLCILLYRLLISPLEMLRRQSVALSSGALGARVPGAIAGRKDELGELARAFNQMAERLEGALTFQRQLLRDMSHELRTPLCRLRVAAEQADEPTPLTRRLEKEVDLMERLIGDSLELAWLDTERPSLPLEPVDVPGLWDVIRENVCFETGWQPERLPCDLPGDCLVLGHLNGLAQAMENILRNAVRHSPEDGVVRLGGHRCGGHWHLWIDDQGPGVAEEDLSRILEPFTRLNAARPGGDGFGLGLSIARSMLRLQGGELWAENLRPGLRLNLRLQVYRL